MDASQGAYGAAVYVRIEYQDQTVSLSLIAAKTKKWLLYNLSAFQGWN